MKSKDLIRILSRITLLTQLGLTFLTPPVLLTLGALWLQERFGTGDWLVVTALLVGLLSGACGAWQLLSAELKKDRRENARAENGGNGKGNSGHEP